MKRSGRKFAYDRDNGYMELATKFDGSRKGSSVFIGWLQSSGLYKPKPSKKGKGGDAGITVAQIAAIHEFGSSDGKIPQRAPIGTAIDTNEEKLTRLIDKLAGNVIDGKETESYALGVLGQFVLNLIRGGIKKGLKPKLAESTLRRKGPNKSTPLIDTGQLIGSSSFEVRKNKK